MQRITQRRLAARKRTYPPVLAAALAELRSCARAASWGMMRSSPAATPAPAPAHLQRQRLPDDLQRRAVQFERVGSTLLLVRLDGSRAGLLRVAWNRMCVRDVAASVRVQRKHACDKLLHSEHACTSCMHTS